MQRIMNGYIGQLKRMAAVAFLLPAVVSCSCAAEQAPNDEAGGQPTHRRIDAAEARRRMGAADAIVLDVRSRPEYESGRIPGARLIPYNEIRSRAPQELSDKDAVILVYCHSGARSDAAARQLASMGYRNVFDFGGIVRWNGETVRGP